MVVYKNSWQKAKLNLKQFKNEPVYKFTESKQTYQIEHCTKPFKLYFLKISENKYECLNI